MIANSDGLHGLELFAIRELHLTDVRDPSHTSIQVSFSAECLSRVFYKLSAFLPPAVRWYDEGYVFSLSVHRGGGGGTCPVASLVSGLVVGGGVLKIFPNFFPITFNLHFTLLGYPPPPENVGNKILATKKMDKKIDQKNGEKKIGQS